MPTKFTRRDVLAGAGALTLAARSARVSAQQPKPNVIFIMADDLGYADVSCYGRREYTTTNVDRLAQSGMRFLHAYSNSAVCSATRTALITGRYQYRYPLGLEEPLNTRDVGLPPDAPTLPSLLKKAGYSTALIGKWHLGEAPKYGPALSGYDRFYGIYGGASDYFEHANLLWDGPEKANGDGYLTHLLADRAASTVQTFARARAPFLISLHFTAPHWPWEGPDDEEESRYVMRDGLRGVNHFDGGSLATYAKMVLAMDAGIGRVLAELERAGIADNTIVIFTSDNGGERFSDTWPFSGKKLELLEGGIRVPAIVRWPGVVRAAATSDQTIMSMDWLPTLLAAAGAATDPSSPPDGIDFGAQLRGGPSVARKLFWRYKHNSQQAMRDGDWKYLKIQDSTFLFNVVDDPLERANFKNRRREVYERMTAEWRAWDATMLPLDPASFTAGHGSNEVADHVGAPVRVRTPAAPPTGTSSGR
jgi:arylsulfatase A-like enzyme